MIDEEEDSGSLDVIVRIAGISGGSEPPLLVRDFERDELIGDGGPMDLPDTVHGAGIFRY